ncbi:MAG: thymidine phosphorylase, partial [Candidatus Thermoplasmatota archaeon]|nr:thymidine phosphorylase [Candidatus Thermoplasmatota archaeon]
QRATRLAGTILDMAGVVAEGEGPEKARQVLEDGRAWRKFQAICQAQGGLRDPPVARHTHPVLAEREGRVDRIDNRRLARVAKLAGAPEDPEAGVLLATRLGDQVAPGDVLFTVHAGNPGELDYALTYVEGEPPVFDIR